jgi:D-serine deaminase-like pyridoxal phosphate-dependent protein
MPSLDELDTPQLLLDLDLVDANLARLQSSCRANGKDLRVHFKSLKCCRLAQYLSARGVSGFLTAKLNEAEFLVAAGITDVMVANQVIGPMKLNRLAKLAHKAKIRVCVDDVDNIREMATIARRENVTLGVLVEVDIGMSRCGVEPGEAVLPLARAIVAEEGLRFDGLQGYDGHLQLLADPVEKRQRCHEGLDGLVRTRKLLQREGIETPVVTGAGTGTWEYSVDHPALTELQPGSFLLMDVAYHAVRPEFACSLSILSTVVSRRPAWYVLDAGSKAVSQDFGKPAIKGRSAEKVARLSEEHTRVEDDGIGPRVGDRREILPAHCCATMNLHRQVVAVRKAEVMEIWPIEASGRYD